MRETIILNEVKTISMPTNQGDTALQEQPEKKKKIERDRHELLVWRYFRLGEMHQKNKTYSLMPSLCMYLEQD